MARGVNKVILIGTCGQDPEIRYLPNGNAVANLSLATTENWIDKKSGQKVEKTEWHRVVIFGKIAGIAGDYLRKGSQVYIEGKLQTREWEKDSMKRYTTEIIVDIQGTMQMIGGRPQAQNATQNKSPITQKTADKAEEGTNSSHKDGLEDLSSFSNFDDIPF